MSLTCDQLVGSLDSGPFLLVAICHLSRYPIVRDSPRDRDTPRIAIPEKKIWGIAILGYKRHLSVCTTTSEHGVSRKSIATRKEVQNLD